MTQQFHSQVEQGLTQDLCEGTFTAARFITAKGSELPEWPHTDTYISKKDAIHPPWNVTWP